MVLVLTTKLTFQPSDVDPANVASIRAWIAEARLGIVLEERVAMPANHQALVFRKLSAS